MRVSVRSQLSILLVLSSSIGLATLAIAAWCTIHSYVLKVARNGLETAVSLKAVEIAISLDMMYTMCLYLGANGPLQQALKRYNDGSNTTVENWGTAVEDMGAALNSVGSLKHTPGLQSQLLPRNQAGPAGRQSVLNVTGKGNSHIALPWEDSSGNPAYLGQGSVGYPPILYPELTISKKQGDISSGSYVATYNEETLGLGSNLILGPLTVNESFSLISMTIPVVDNYSETNILGWLTVVQDTRTIDRILHDYTGLGNTGLTVMLGPMNEDNLFGHGGTPTEQRDVRFLIPVRPSATSRCPTCTGGLSFPANAYPAVQSALSDGFNGRQELNSLLSTRNELNEKVSVAYATPPTTLVDWIIIVEQSTSEFWKPVDELRTIILACLFSVLGFSFFASIPLAHWAVRPITRLRAATESTIDPLYGSSTGSLDRIQEEEESEPPSDATAKPGLLSRILWWRQKNPTTEARDRDVKRFRIPSKVDTSKHWLKDDLLDLMETFNEMSDELFMQYSKLEERVRMRTLELEQSKRAAEAANESKTLFVANVSHELKTPLNGILGMCATSIEDNDTEQMRTSLSIIYKSGDLLLRTLNDLLTFSTNQVGSRELMLEEREFTLHDLESQILTIFEKQAVDKAITLLFECEELPSYAGDASVKLKEMTVWGDVHRILQIVINLVSNSMKYTPENGSVTVTVRRSSEQAPRRLSFWPEQLSFHSRKSAQSRKSRASRRSARVGTANFINPTEGYQLQEQTLPPPGNDFYLEFDVRDTGQGIPEEMQNRIFEPFVQGEAGLNRRHSGTGLGLSICNQLTNLMRGTIGLKSTVGLGTTFTVKLPMRQVLIAPSTEPSIDLRRRGSRASSWAETEKYDEKVSGRDRYDDVGVVASPIENKRYSMEVKERGSALASIPGSPAEKEEPKLEVDAAPRPSTSHEPGTATPKPIKKAKKESKDDKAAEHHDFSKLRVLVAEDNKVNQQVILRMLKMEQILQVTIAEDGQQALDRVKEVLDSDTEHSQYDVIFMDIQMPNMDGLTSTRSIRESGYDGPIVALTAYAEKNNIDDCFESGMNHFLAKPLKKPQLHDALTKLCSKLHRESKGAHKAKESDP